MTDLFIDKIDRILIRKIGISVHDLADADFYHLRRDGYTPAEAAIEVLENDFIGRGLLRDLEAEGVDLIDFFTS